MFPDLTFQVRNVLLGHVNILLRNLRLLPLCLGRIDIDILDLLNPTFLLFRRPAVLRIRPYLCGFPVRRGIGLLVLLRSFPTMPVSMPNALVTAFP